jgi:hypothetical protein
MDMRFETWNIRSLYRSWSLKTVSGELAKYKFDLVLYKRSDGTRVALSQQAIIPSSMEMGMLIIA